MHFPLFRPRRACSRWRVLSAGLRKGTFPFVAFLPYYMQPTGRSQAFPGGKTPENRPPPIFLRFPLCGCATLCYNMLNFNDWRTIPMASKTNKKAEQKQKMVRIVAVVACGRTAADGHPALCRFQPPALSKDKNTPLPLVRRRRFSLSHHHAASVPLLQGSLKDSSSQNRTPLFLFGRNKRSPVFRHLSK